MAGEPHSEPPTAVRVERTRDEVSIKFPTADRLLRSVLPPAASGHLYAAQREVLLAARVLLDAAIERLERAQRGEPAPRPRRSEIKLD